MAFVSTFLMVIACAIAYRLSLWIYVAPSIPGIPYHKSSSWMPWGDLASLGLHNVRTWEVFDWLSLQCLVLKSPIVQLFLPTYSTTHPVILVADLREIEDIVLRRSRTIDRSPIMHEFFSLLFPGATIGMQTNQSFKHQRNLWNCILSPSFMTEVAAPRFHAANLELIRLWQRKADMAAGLAFKADEDIRQTAFDATWAMTTGNELGLSFGQLMQLNVLNNNGFKRSRDKIDFQGITLPPLYRALRTLLFYLDLAVQGVNIRLYKRVFRCIPGFYKAQKVMDEALNDCLTRSRTHVTNTTADVASTKHDDNGLGRVLRRGLSSEHDTGGALLDAALKDELLELLVTGHETTASSTGWALKYLADHQSVQMRLRAELQRAFPGVLPSASQIMATAVPYLDAVISEVLRISNTGPISFRETVSDCNILGHDIPKGTPIWLLTGGPSYLHPEAFEVDEKDRSPSSRASVNESRAWSWDTTTFALNTFAPERWLDPEGKFLPTAGPSLPFSAGRRGCFGKNIALMELRLALTMLVLAFHFPKLDSGLSSYASYDSLTRMPRCCYIKPQRTSY